MYKSGIQIGKRMVFCILSNETIFSMLMAGKIDAIFAYGEGFITTEGSKDWIMTNGYTSCLKYRFLTTGEK